MDPARNKREASAGAPGERDDQRLWRLYDDLCEAMRVAAHDLKAPLRAVSNLAHWIEEDIHTQLGARLAPETQEQMQLLQQRLAHMKQLVDGLGDYLRAGQVGAQSDDIDFDRLVAELGIELGFPADTLSTEPRGLHMRACRDALRRVLAQLMDNARTHSDHPPGRVDVTVLERPGEYEFVVEDDGPGVDPKQHEHVFGVFRKLASSPPDALGLGLALVKRTVTAHGGRVWIVSQGRGTQVRFTWSKQAPPSHEEAEGDDAKDS